MIALAGMIDMRWETMTSDGVQVELDVDGDAPFEVVLWDQSPGLPPEGKPLLDDEVRTRAQAIIEGK